MCALMSVCVCVWSVCIATSGDCSLTTIISDLQSAQPAKAQGHLWTQTFSSFSRHYFILPLRPFIRTCHSLVISRCAFLLVHSPSVSSVFPPLPHNPSPVHLSHCAFYQLIHFFCSSSAGLVSPTSLYLCFSCRSTHPPFTLSLSFCLFGSFPSSLALSGKHKIGCICAHTNTYSMLYIHIQRDVHTRTESEPRAIVSITTRIRSALLMLS